MWDLELYFNEDAQLFKNLDLAEDGLLVIPDVYQVKISGGLFYIYSESGIIIYSKASIREYLLN